MKVTYRFITGEMTEVEVDTSIGAVVIGSRREEESGDRKERRHCYSLDAITYEGTEYGTDETPATILEAKELSAHIRECLSHLTDTQQRRLLMLASGLSMREIARREGVDIKTVRESINSARENFKKFFER